MFDQSNALHFGGLEDWDSQCRCGGSTPCLAPLLPPVPTIYPSLAEMFWEAGLCKSLGVLSS